MKEDDVLAIQDVRAAKNTGATKSIKKRSR